MGRARKSSNSPYSPERYLARMPGEAGNEAHRVTRVDLGERAESPSPLEHVAKGIDAEWAEIAGVAERDRSSFAGFEQRPLLGSVELSRRGEPNATKHASLADVLHTRSTELGCAAWKHEAVQRHFEQGLDERLYDEAVVAERCVDPSSLILVECPKGAHLSTAGERERALHEPGVRRHGEQLVELRAIFHVALMLQPTAYLEREASMIHPAQHAHGGMWLRFDAGAAQCRDRARRRTPRASDEPEVILELRHEHVSRAEEFEGATAVL
ncbi:MAG TPA: hypothetical protein VL400_02100, partial [Polyangiaceae bacterium]|nr:hypothetical protein [Polyangiaceae bacterium]